MAGGGSVGAEEIASKLTRWAEEDLGLFGRLLELCRDELSCLAQPGLDALDPILREKDSIMQRVTERAEEAAPLWAELEGARGEGPDIGELSRVVERIRETIEAIQAAEAEIARRLPDRAEQVGRSLSSLRRGGKAMGAYQPFRRYAPRFVDRKE